MNNVKRLRFDRMGDRRGRGLSLIREAEVGAVGAVRTFRASGVVYVVRASCDDGTLRATGVVGAFCASGVGNAFRGLGVVGAFQASDAVGVVNVLNVDEVVVVVVFVLNLIVLIRVQFWVELYSPGSRRCFVAGSTR